MTTHPVILGHVDVPTGKLLILDPGLAKHWKHDQLPTSKLPEADYQIAGPDAKQAAMKFDRQFDPGFLFDIAANHAHKILESFNELCLKEQLCASLNQMPNRVPHLERAFSAIDIGHGCGVVQYDGLWAVAVGGVECGDIMEIRAYRMPEGEFGRRWHRLEMVSLKPPIGMETCQPTVEGIMVDHGQFIFSDLNAFGDFKMWQPFDGLADFVFWGKDAELLARRHRAAEIGDGEFGFKNVSLEELARLTQPIVDDIKSSDMRVAQDYRPHCNLERLNSQIRVSETRSGTVVLREARSVGCDNTWGDGIFGVQRCVDQTGRVTRVIMELGTEHRIETMRQIVLRNKLAMVTRRFTHGSEPIRFGERVEPHRDSDSGWLFTTGLETQEEMDNSANLSLMRIEEILRREPTLAKVLTLSVGSLICREGDQFVLE